MHTQTVVLDRQEAVHLHRKYLEHRHNQGSAKAEDKEVERAYKLISQGKMIIRALESIRVVGLNEQKLPKLALVNAKAKVCHLMASSQSLVFSQARWGTQPSRPGTVARNIFTFPRSDFPGATMGHFEAVVPHVPPDIRPVRGIENYHILFEAEWTKRPPVDPMLLRRIGAADLWLVVGAWDLTEVERAAMVTRM